MAESNAAAAPVLQTNIESANFDEKAAQNTAPADVKPKVEEEDDEDIDALIEDLESQDGHGFDEEEDEDAPVGSGRVVPEDMLQTDTRVGLTESELTLPLIGLCRAQSRSIGFPTTRALTMVLQARLPTAVASTVLTR